MGTDDAPDGKVDEHVVAAELATRGDEGRKLECRRLMQQGLAATEPERQLELFERAHLADMNDPMAMSYHGMAIACVRHRYLQGIVFCEEAVRRMGPHPDLLVNLAKAYLAARNKREAVHALRRALAHSSGDDQRARIELASLGLRRPPVIGFLPRSFFLNKYLGMMRHWFLQRGAPKVDALQPTRAELGRLSGDLDAARRELAREQHSRESS